MRYLLLLFMIFFLGCSTKKKKDESIILSKLIETDVLDKKVYVVMQLNGCGFCIESMINFAKDNLTNRQLGFVVSIFPNVKIEEYFTPSELSYLRIDKGSKATERGLLLGIATVYFIDNGKIRKKTILTPDNYTEVQREILGYL